MDLRQLRYFTAVAESGNITKAANACHVAQSAFSRHIQLLEAELGTALLVRHGRGVHLTEAGTNLLDRARFILKNVEDARADILAGAKEPHGLVTIALSPSMATKMFGALAEECRNRFPRVKMGLIEGMGQTLSAAVEEGRAEIGILTDPQPSRTLIYHTLRSEDLFLIGAAKPPPIRDISRVADLSGLPLVLPSAKTALRNLIDREAEANGVTLNIAFEAESFGVLRDILSRRLAYAILPPSAIPEEIAGGQFSAYQLRGLSCARVLARRTDRSSFKTMALWNLIKGGQLGASLKIDHWLCRSQNPEFMENMALRGRFP